MEIHVNQHVRIFHLGSMSENQIINPDNMSFTFPKPGGNESVVVIANIVQNNHNLMKDSQFSVYTKTNNFGNGAQALDVTKSYWRQPIRLPHGGITKPIKVLVNAYEITLNVNYPIMQNQ